MKYFVYILKSVNGNKYYTGSTINLERRLKEHNSGKTKSTKSYRPWKIIYTEEYQSCEESVAREKYLKSGIGREEIRNSIKK